MAEQAAPKGPDLAAGIDATQLEPGEKLLGQVGGTAVLLVRLGDDFVAVGAKCTHYSGPLADGLIDGETVRCPWHHACFNLRTGEALRAPALDPIASWKVERDGARIFVRDKVTREPLAPTYPVALDASRAPRNIVVVGAGAAGSAAVEMLRRSGYDGTLTVVDEDLDAPCDRPNLSKDYLAGTAQEDWIPLRGADFYPSHGVSVVRRRVTHLDVAARALTLASGDHVSYDALLLATGAEPVRLDLPGADLPHVHYLRSFADSRAIIARAAQSRTAVVVGASFIGLEVAASLRARGLDVHVVGPEKVPLARVLGEDLGAFVRSVHESHGVRFHLGHTLRQIESDGVVLDDGTRLDAGLVAIGAGVKPRLALAEQASLAMDNGILVNEYLETSAPGVFAAGDIARWPYAASGERIRVEHWVVAQRQGQAAARNMLGARQPFTDAPFFWSAHYDVTINYVGHAATWDRAEIDGSVAEHDAAVRLFRNGRLVALATIFRDEESLRAEMEMERR